MDEATRYRTLLEIHIQFCGATGCEAVSEGRGPQPTVEEILEWVEDEARKITWLGDEKRVVFGHK